MRRRAVAVLLALLCVPLAGCGRIEQDRDRALAALDQTEKQARDFTYTDVAARVTTTVTGSIADDLRYRLDASINGAPAASEVVVDDAVALKVSAPAAPRLSNVASGVNAGSNSPRSNVASGVNVGATSGPLSQVASGANAGGVSSPLPPGLAGGGWVVDTSGAAVLTVGGGIAKPTGRDPLYDALSVIQYVRDAVNRAQTVQRFNPDSESYRPKFDPFPRPKGDVVRYDLIPPPLPPRQAGTDVLTQQSIPDITFFRQMSIYVENGAVVSVRERISVAAQLLDPASNLEVRLGDYVQMPAGASTAQQARALLGVLNKRLVSSGRAPIRERTMELDLRRGGGAAIEIPAGAIPGNLSAIKQYGQVLHEAG